MVIHSSHALGIAWISASREIFKKYLTFECFCFAIFFFHTMGIHSLHFGGNAFPLYGKNTGKKNKFFAALQVFFNIILMMSMMKNVPAKPQKLRS